jgi:hypothetical protein
MILKNYRNRRAGIMKSKAIWNEVVEYKQNFATDPQEEPCSEKVTLTIEIHGQYPMADENIRHAAKQAINRYFKTHIRGSKKI